MWATGISKPSRKGQGACIPLVMACSYTTFETIARAFRCMAADECDRFCDSDQYRQCEGKRSSTGLCKSTSGKTGEILHENLSHLPRQQSWHLERQRNYVLLSRNTDMASYDDSGVTGHKSCYVLEDGNLRVSLWAVTYARQVCSGASEVMKELFRCHWKTCSAAVIAPAGMRSAE